MNKSTLFSLHERTIEFAPGEKNLELRIQDQETIVLPIPNPSNHPHGLMNPKGDDLPTIEFRSHTVAVINFSYDRMVFLAVAYANSIPKSELPAEVSEFKFKDLMKFREMNATYFKLTLKRSAKKEKYSVLVEKFDENSAKAMSQIQNEYKEWSLSLAESCGDGTPGEKIGPIGLSLAGMLFAKGFTKAWKTPRLADPDVIEYLLSIP
ncbi:MAG: hypothetical protein WCI57_05315 [Candidatus Berkelbacteria bacterium]